MECEPTTWKSINLRVVRVFNQRLKFLVRSSTILQSKTLKRFNEFINYPLHSLYFFFGEWERFDLASNCFFYKRFLLWNCEFVGERWSWNNWVDVTLLLDASWHPFFHWCWNGQGMGSGEKNFISSRNKGNSDCFTTSSWTGTTRRLMLIPKRKKKRLWNGFISASTS